MRVVYQVDFKESDSSSNDGCFTVNSIEHYEENNLENKNGHK